MLLALHALPVTTVPDETAATKARDEAQGYFLTRLRQLQYPHFLAQGYPIGSGAVESAGKLVVQARLKGSGMRWGRDHLNPMVALRTIVCSGRWAEAWPQITERLRAQTRQHQHDRWLRRHPPAVPATAPAPPVPKPVHLASAVKKMRAHSAPPLHSKDGRPAADHPWRSAICRHA